VVAGSHTVTPAALAVGALAQLTCAATGIAVGLVCSRLVIRHTGYAILAALGLIGTFLLVPALPPVAPIMRLLAASRPPAQMLAPLGGFAAAAALLLAASTAFTISAAARQRT
jgi:hypothetical protein